MYLRNEAELGFTRGEGMTRLSVKRGKGSEGRRGSSRARGSTLPRLARWAGVGVFVFGALLLSCDEGPTEPTLTPSGQGFVWVGTDNVYTENWLIKVDVGTGEIHRRGVKGFKTGEWLVGIPVEEETGEFFLHNPSFFLARYDAKGETIWRKGETPYRWRDYSSIAFYVKGNVVWGTDEVRWSLEKRDGSNGKLLLMKHIAGLNFNPKPPIQIDQRDGSVWAASPSYLVKLSANGTKMFEEEFTFPERVIRNMAINENSGNLWVIVMDRASGERYRLIKYSSAGSKLLTKDTFINQEPTGMAVDPKTGDVWLAYGYGVFVTDKNGDYKKPYPNYNNIRAITFAGNKAIIGGGEESKGYWLYALNKDTGKEIWQIKDGYRPVKYIGYVQR